MKSQITKSRILPDGTLELIGVETVHYSSRELALVPSEPPRVLSDTTVGGRREIVIAVSRQGRGRPTDPLKRRHTWCGDEAEIERHMSEKLYDGVINTDDQPPINLLPSLAAENEEQEVK